MTSRRTALARTFAAVTAVLCLVACEQVAVQAYDPPREFDTGGKRVDTLLGTSGSGRLPVTLHDRMLYAVGSGTLTAVDVTSGRTRWEVESRWSNQSAQGTRAPARVRVGGRWQVVTAFSGDVEASGTKKAYSECEVLAVDARTGEKRWQVRFRLPVPDDEDPPEVAFIGADKRVAVVGYGDRTYAVDVRKHEVRWHRDNLYPQVLDDGVVTGTAEAEGSSGYRLVGVDATGNQVRWRRSEELIDPVVVSAGPGLLAVSGTDYGAADPLFQLLRTSGEQVDRKRYGAETGSSAQPCRYDGRSVTVCIGRSGSDRVVYAYATGSGKRLWTLRTTERREPPLVSGVFHGLVYGEIQDDRGTTEELVLLDARTGKDEKGDPGVAPVLVSRFGALAAGDGLRVHRATG